MGDPTVVAAFGQRSHSGALHVLGPHAGHFEQPDIRPLREHGVDAAAQVGDEEFVTRRGGEAVERAIVVDVEHVPRTDDHQHRVGVRCRLCPLLLPTVTDREVVPELHGAVVLNPSRTHCTRRHCR